MGKKRVIKKGGGGVDKGRRSRSLAKTPKKKMATGLLYIKATYNNTMVLLTDLKGNAIMSSSSGELGFKGAKKGTPYAAAKVGELIGEKAQNIGLKDVQVIIKGVGSGRESAIRAFTTKGIGILSIKDRTPVPHNGCRPRKPRRV